MCPYLCMTYAQKTENDFLWLFYMNLCFAHVCVCCWCWRWCSLLFSGGNTNYTTNEGISQCGYIAMSDIHCSSEWNVQHHAHLRKSSHYESLSSDKYNHLVEHQSSGFRAFTLVVKNPVTIQWEWLCQQRASSQSTKHWYLRNKRTARPAALGAGHPHESLRDVLVLALSEPRVAGVLPAIAGHVVLRSILTIQKMLRWASQQGLVCHLGDVSS